MKTIFFPTVLRLSLGLALALILASPPAAASNGMERRPGGNSLPAVASQIPVPAAAPIGVQDRVDHDHAARSDRLAWDRVGSPLPSLSSFG